MFKKKALSILSLVLCMAVLLGVTAFAGSDAVRGIPKKTSNPHPRKIVCDCGVKMNIAEYGEWGKWYTSGEKQACPVNYARDDYQEFRCRILIYQCRDCGIGKAQSQSEYRWICPDR